MFMTSCPEEDVSLMLREDEQQIHLYIKEIDVVQEVRYAARLSTPE